METLISSFDKVNFEHNVPPHVINDLEYICHCYLNGITELNFGDVSCNTVNQEENENDTFTYKDLYFILDNRLSKQVSYVRKMGKGDPYA